MGMDNYRQLSARTRWMLSIAHVFKTFSWPAAFMWAFLFIISISVVIGVNFLHPRLEVMSLPFSSLELKEWEAYVLTFGYSLRSGTLPPILTLSLGSSKEEWLAACGAATLAQMESAIFSLASWRRWRSPKPKAKRL